MADMDVRSRTRTRVRIWALTLGCLGVLAATGWFVVPQLDRMLTGGPILRRLRSDMDRALSAGSTRREVNAWFARHGIQPDPITDGNGRVIGLTGSVPDSTWLIPALIDIDVAFDEQQRLKRKRIDRKETWP